MSLKNKRILITAGPTWVPIDNVRVISNTATGQTGILLAENFSRLGAKVTLLLGPVGVCCLSPKIKLIKYKFFNELKDKLFGELKNSEFDCVIHSAAVSDYEPERYFDNKIDSGRKKLSLKLRPTEKIINRIKKIDASLFTVGFKFEPQRNKDILIKQARHLMAQANLDLVVANSIKGGRYLAYLVAKKEVGAVILTKNNLVKKLIVLISKKI